MSMVSVIVPVYKVESYLDRCVQSILCQSFSDFELILVDDGSPDNCGKICDEYARKDSRIKVIHKKNGGLSEARNYGIDSATGEWLFFLDSDDWIHPQTIEKLYEAAVENNVSVSMCGYSETNGESPAVDVSEKAEMWLPKELYLKHRITSTIACAKLYKKECFKNIRYPIGKLHEDEFVTYRVLFEQEKIAFIDQPYYAYFINCEGIMNGKWKPQRLVIFEAFEQQISFFKEKNDDELILFNEKRYLWYLVNEHKKAICGEFIKEGKWIKRKAFFAILNSSRKIFDPDNLWTMEYFFPRFVRCYWLAKSVLRKISRKKSE